MSRQHIHSNISCDESDLKLKYRDRIELLRNRAELLVGLDKTMVTMYLDNGNNFRQIANLAGVNEANIARRIRKVIRRLTSCEYIKCLQSRDKFTGFEMNLSRDYFLRRMSIRKLAEKHGHTYYRTRQTINKIRQIIKIAETQ